MRCLLPYVLRKQRMMLKFGLRLSFVTILLATGCQLPYSFPKPGEPQALVKLRRVYSRSDGTHLREAAFIGDMVVNDHRVDASLTAASTVPMPIRPVEASWNLVTNFHHFETRTFQESYLVSTPYTTTRSESYSCGSGYGATASYRTCSRTVTSTSYRHETRYRTVTRTVAVTDAACSVLFTFTPVVNAEYLLQHNFDGPNACTVSCFRQQSGNDGTFSSKPCWTSEFRAGGGKVR